MREGKENGRRRRRKRRTMTRRRRGRNMEYMYIESVPNDLIYTHNQKVSGETCSKTNTHKLVF